MIYHSTRDNNNRHSLSEAITLGLADDGGLFVPQQFPHFDSQEFARAEVLPEIARIFLEPFFAGDPLEAELPAICQEAFSFPIPLRPLASKPGLSVLELFHGPTAAFKDVGARFLAACLRRLEQHNASPLTILVATSGDTGSAVAAAFHRVPGINVAVLYPAGLVSPRQEHQLTCWGDNVRAFRVDGTFDDCQRLVKRAFVSPSLADRRLSSANSINIGRLLPQAVYYAAASLWNWRERSEKASFIVPTGNLGNAVAGCWARAMGLPLEAVALATNANRIIPEYLDSGQWQPRVSIATLASAMDVGDPSNMERMQTLYGDFSSMRENVTAWSVSDDQIRAQLCSDFKEHDELWCPHTATAAYVSDHYLDGTRNRIIVATAHPAKFETIIEPLLDTKVPVPSSLQRLLQLDSQHIDLSGDFDEFADML